MSKISDKLTPNQDVFVFSKASEDLTEYIVSDSNRLAHTVIANWPHNWGVLPYERSLMLLGPKSSGKTFLAKKWQQLSNALILSSPEELTSQMLMGSQESDNQVKSFVVDNLDFSCNQETLLHFFNFAHENSHYLLLTARSIPEIALQDLSSRIKAVRSVNIERIDDQMMELLIFKFFSNHSITVTSDVTSYLQKHLAREFDHIIKTIGFINITALKHRRKITVPFVKEILSL